MSSETIYDAVIVGGGPAGLTAAWALRDKKTLLLEQRHRLGGRLKSLPRGDYWINLGGLCSLALARTSSTSRLPSG